MNKQEIINAKITFQQNQRKKEQQLRQMGAKPLFWALPLEDDDNNEKNNNNTDYDYLDDIVRPPEYY